MNIYYFADHHPADQLIADLGGHITKQFKGGIRDVHRRGNQIAFTGTLFIGGCEIKACHAIPADSIVVIEDLPVLQGAWLEAGVYAVLVPQIEQTVGKWGSIMTEYRGLLQVRRIQVETTPWVKVSAMSV